MKLGEGRGVFAASMRRRRLLGVAAGGGAAAFAAACGSKARTDDAGSGATGTGTGTGLATVVTGQAAPGQTEQIKRGGTFTWLVSTGPPRQLDPHFETFPSSSSVALASYNALLRFTPDVTKIEPELATAMPEQPDDRTFTFKLRQGVKFHNVAPANGREMTSEDVKYSLERQATNNPGKFQHAYYFLNRLDSIETPDKYTVKVTTKQPYAPFMSYIASPWTVVVLREQVERDGDLNKTAIGTGPFLFDEWQKGVAIKYKRNPEYWAKDAQGGALPYVDAVIFPEINDPNTVQAQFVTKDLLAAPIQNTFVDEVKKKVAKANYRAVPSQYPRQMRTAPYDNEKVQQKQRFADIRVRQALVQAVNKKEVLDLVYSGDGVVIKGPILPLYPQWEMKEELVKYDPEDSKRLLAAAGFPNGWDDEMIYSENSAGGVASQIGEVLKNQLAKIGVRLTLKPLDSTSYYNKNYGYDYTLSHHQPLNQPDPDENLASYFGPAATFYRWGNKEIYAIIAKQAETMNVQERQKVVQDAQRMIVQDYPMNFMFTNNSHYFTHPSVKGWFFSNDLYNGRVESVWIDPTA